MTIEAANGAVHLTGLDGVPPIVSPASQAVIAGGFVFLAGQVPKDPETGVIPDTFEAQACRVLRNLEAAARAAGASLHDAVSVRVFLGDMANAPAFNAIYREIVPEPFPVRTGIHSVIPGYPIEIDAILYAPHLDPRADRGAGRLGVAGDPST